MTTQRFSLYARLALAAVAAGAISACAPTRQYYEPARYYGEPAGDYYAPDREYYAPDREYYAPAPQYSAPQAYYGEYRDYWYYPAIETYYDPRVSIYIYQEHNHWVSARALPPHLRPRLGHHVTVRSPHDRPYADHHRHRERYASGRRDPERYDADRHDGKRYKKTPPVRTRDNGRYDAPRQPLAERDRHQRRENDGNRNWQNKNGQDNVSPRGRHPDFSAAPGRNKDAQRVREIRKDEPRNNRREQSARRDSHPVRDSDPVQQQYRQRAPEIRQAPAATRRDAAAERVSGRREPAARRESAQRQEPATATRNEDTRNKNRQEAAQARP